MPESPRYQPHFEFAPPPEGFRVAMDWQMGSDAYTKSLAQKLGYLPLPQELQLAEKIVRRDTDALPRISEVWGRAVLAPSQQELILGVPYDTLEIGGFGNQPMVRINGSAGQVDYGHAVALPSADNFALSNPTITRTNIIDGGREVVLGDPYSFSGAYTKKQAARKVAANLFVLNRLSNMRPPAFLVPIPMAIGHYPDIVGPDGDPAYYIVFKVPYQGKRDGRMIANSSNARDVYRYGEHAANSLPGIAKALAYISNSLGLTHNQPHPGNAYTPEPGEGTLPYLADFSTMYPLQPKKQEAARARELARGMQSAWDSVRAHFVGTDEQQFIRHVFGNTIKNYLGIAIPGGPPTVDTSDYFFEVAIKAAIDKGLIPAKLPHLESWDKIMAIEKELMRKMKRDR